MPLPDSTFLFEIIVVRLQSFVECREFYIKSKFTNIFKLNLKDPNNSDYLKSKIRRQKKKNKVRSENIPTHNPPIEGKEIGQSVLFTSSITTLITTMKNYAIEVTLYHKNDHRKKIGTTHVPWSPLYIDYLYKVATKDKAVPIMVTGVHSVYDEMTSRRVATIFLSTKLTYLRDKITTLNNSLSISYKKSYIIHNTLNNSISNTNEEPIIIEPETIHTVHIAEKPKKKNNKPINANKTRGSTSSVDTLNEKKYENAVDTTDDSSTISMQTQNDKIIEKTEINNNTLYLVRSDSDLNRKIQNNVARTKSCSFIYEKRFNFLNYVFGDTGKPLSKRVICVGYFSVENDLNDGSSSKASSSRSPSKNSPDDSAKNSPKNSDKNSPSPRQDSEASDCGCTDENRGPYSICDKYCNKRQLDNTCTIKACEDNATHKISMVQCDKVRCGILERRVLSPPPDDTIHLDVTSLRKSHNDVVDETVEDVTGGMKAKMKYDARTCMCECECTFGFVKRTTYCRVCGGYEKPGEDMPKKALTAPFPCPVYHKIIDKNKLKSTSGSDRSKMGDSKSSNKKITKSPTSAKPASPGPTSAKSQAAPATNVESDKEYCRKKKKDRFKFNYGYTGIPPQIGHSKCVMPCTGTLNAVPKNMGWLWTAEDIPGMKPRPSWKPGCVHKQVLHLLRMAKDPGIILSKKKKKPEKKKRPLKRPLLTVAKKDGEYTVTMETMKAYTKPRALNQQPFEDKPVLTYTIGRTEEENRERHKRKEREQRRLQRDQRAFIQSAFTDMCKEICLKTYQQALGFFSDTETPDCSCYPNNPGPEDTNLDRSCSCSEHEVSFGTDTDSDEWLIEFTPPTAHFDPTYKAKKITKQDNESQYSYLDYRVKLLDRSGNQVVRFFKGPDGKTQCSDLGGFWSPEHKWLEINVDGFIAPDDRWAPMIFIGPQGDNIDCESTGKFQDIDGTWLTVGVDGYVDATGKWKFYTKRKDISSQKKKEKRRKEVLRGKKAVKDGKATSDTTWSCSGAASPKQLSKLGILGHGQDKNLLLQKLTEMLQHGEDVRIPETSMVPRIPGSKKGKTKGFETFESSLYSERSKCRHAVPSDKGIVAVDGQGNKTYFRLKNYKNKRPAQRLANLTHQGISTSSFHIPCLSSFINKEMLKKQQYERFLKNQAAKKANDMEYGTTSESRDATTQAEYRYRYII